MPQLSERGFRIGAVVLTVAFAALCASRLEIDGFGAWHDDTLYLSSAKALAEGRGYILPSVPGEPEQTKYPILYSWLLSWIWRAWPDFPANLQAIYALGVLFGCGLVAASTALLRGLGAGRAEALAIAAWFALHPFTVYWTDTVMSDVLFALLAVAACEAGRRALADPKVDRRLWAAALGLAVAAVLCRGLGVAVAGGLALAALVARHPYAAAAAGLAAAPIAWEMLDAAGPVVEAAAPAALSGYRQTLTYYLSYGGFWKLGAPDGSAFLAQFGAVASQVAVYPAALAFGFPADAAAHPALRAVAVALGVGVVKGVVGRARRSGFHPIHAAALFYLPITLAWNYAPTTRFFLPFAPLLLAGAWFEIGELARTIGAARRGRDRAERAAGALLAATAAALIVWGAWRLAWDLPRRLEAGAVARVVAAADKRAAYAWLRAETSADARVVAYEDVLVHLHAGRQGLRPMAFSTAALFLRDESILEADLARLDHVARALGARYWLRAEDDFQLEPAEERVRGAVDALLADQPVVYRSPGGRVRVHDVSRMSSPD